MENNVIEKKMIISSSPHLLKRETTRNIMWLVILCLLPATFFGFFAFGFKSILIVISSIITSLFTEAIILKIRKKRISIDDGSAFLTGLLVGLNMPPTVPLYIPIISSVFAIGLVKHAFGGLGENWANPAIAARVFALFAWTKKMTFWAEPFSGNFIADSISSASGTDAVSAATPLKIVKSAIMEGTASQNILTGKIITITDYFKSIFTGPMDILNTKADVSYFDLFFGLNKAGCIGEISVFLLLVGALLLMSKKIVTLDIPVAYIGTVIFLAWIFGGLQFGKWFFQGDFLFHILTGGLALGAFFMATDMVTTPITIKGRIIFGIGCGIITMLVRFLGGLPEGVSLSILFMNMLTPAIDRFMKIKPMGFIKKQEV